VRWCSKGFQINKDAKVNDFIGKIKEKLEENKQQVLAKFAHVKLDDKRMNEFFERAKEASTGVD
jgi:hypothetical protein